MCWNPVVPKMCFPKSLQLFILVSTLSVEPFVVKRKLIFMFGAGTSLAERCGPQAALCTLWMYWNPVVSKMCFPKSLQLFILVSTLLVESVVKREVRCPVPKDTLWQYRDKQCPGGKQYHCFENGDGVVVAEGCYAMRKCMRGAHPVVDGSWIVCDLCETGYQPVEGLPSNVYAFSECYHHSAPCNPEYGQSECQAATAEVDVGCTCNASLGFSPKFAFQNCDCFTQDDPCSGCQFTGCPNGTIKNDRGFCEPEPDKAVPSSTSPPTKESGRNIKTTTLKLSSSDSNTLPDWTLAIIIISVVILVLVAVMLIAGLCYCQHRRAKKQNGKKEGTSTDEKESNKNSTNNVHLLSAHNVYLTSTQQALLNVNHLSGLHLSDTAQIAVNGSHTDQNGLNSESSHQRGSRPAYESPGESSTLQLPPLQEEPAAESGAAGQNAHSSPAVSPPGGRPSSPSVAFPSSTESLSPSAPPPSLTMDASQAEDVGQAPPTSRKSERASKKPYMPRTRNAAGQTARKCPASPCSPAMDEAGAETTLLSGPHEQTEGRGLITPGDREEDTSSEETNLKTPFLGDSVEARFQDDNTYEKIPLLASSTYKPEAKVLLQEQTTHDEDIDLRADRRLPLLGLCHNTLTPARTHRLH